MHKRTHISSNRKCWAIWVFAFFATAFFEASSQPAQATSTSTQSKQTIFCTREDEKPCWGIFIHFLPTQEKYAEQITNFNIKALSNQLSSIKAKYLIFTLGQNSGVYSSPNNALISICQNAAAHTSQRDIPLELGAVLDSKDIGLILYLPFRSPQANPEMMDCLEDKSEQLPPTKRFIANWSKVIREWSDRYGTKVAGWWFDGVYNTSGMTDSEWEVFCSAAISGNPNRLVALNAGEGLTKSTKIHSACQNWMAGEFNHIDLSTMPKTANSIAEGIQKHVLTPIGDSWGKLSQPNYSAVELKALLHQAKNQNFQISLDVPIEKDGTIQSTALEIIKEATRGY